VGSTLDIVSAPGAGTQVRVKANLHEVRLRNRMLTVVKNRFRSRASFAANR
jgi:hypothetical protein